MSKPLLIASLLLASHLAMGVDLIESLQAAKSFDATYAAARQTLQAGLEKNEQARALLLPKVTFSGNGSYNYNSYEAGQGTGSYDRDGHSFGYGVNATQPVYRIENLAGADQLRKQAALAEVQYRVAEQDLILRVARAYFEVVAAEEKMRVIDAQKAAISQQLALAKKSFEVGVATITDTDETQTRYDAILSQEIAASNDLEIKREVFAQLTALDPEKLAAIGDRQQPSAPQPNNLSDWLSRAQNGNFGLASQRLNLDIAKREIDKYRAETSPSLDLVASYGDAWKSGGISNSGARDRNGTGVVGLQLSIPIYTGGNRSSQFREAIAKEDAQRSNVEATRRSVIQSAQSGFLGVKNGAAQIRALQQALVSSKSLVDSTTLGQEVGVRTTIDVLNAQQQYYSTRYDLTVARYGYLYSRLQLLAAVGDLTEKEIQEINNWLVQ